MLIKEAVVQNCSKCGRYEKEISPEQHGCDQCGKPIVPYGNDERLDITVFGKDNGTHSVRYFLCSWKCVFRFAKTVKTDYFFTLPYVNAENKLFGRRAKDFQHQIRKLGRNR